MIDYDQDAVKEWIESRFDSVRIASKSGEYYVNSIFLDDNGHHLYINPIKGVYQCKKSDNAGTLIDLVKQVENCSWEDAKELIAGNDIRKLESRLEKYFGNICPVPKNKPLTGLALPPNTFAITALSSSTGLRNKVIDYLNNRKIPINDLYFCVAGEYADRIIIPYWYNDSIRYFNGRYIGNRKNSIRYRGPDGSCGVGKSDVIFYPKKITKKGKLYLTEGEFDAMSLSLCGVPSAAMGGKEISYKQMAELEGYDIVLAFDTDKAGKNAVIKSIKDLNLYGFKNLSRVCCPQKFKDWNEMFVSANPGDINEWINNNEKTTDSFKIALDSLF